MDYYKQNLRIMEELFPELAESLKEENTEKETEKDYEIFVEDIDSVYPVFRGERDGKSYYLSSPYDGLGYENTWVKQFDTLTIGSVVFHFGMARIGYIKKLCLEHRDTVQVIFEPSKEVFLELMKRVDLSFLHDKIMLMVNGLNEDEWNGYVIGTTHFTSLPVSHWMCVPNYEKLFKEEFEEYRERMKHRATESCLDRNTMLRFSDELARNYRDNIKHVMRSYDLIHFMMNFPKGKPAIIVSAGPSLNNNIEELKNAVGKAFIIATDTALKPLINHNIIPDMAVTVDPSKPLLLFEKEEVWKIPLVLVESANSQLTDRHKGKLFFTLNADSVMHPYYERYGKEAALLETGGSVANNAFSLAKVCGCDPIILIGQDLAFTGQRSHADGTFKDKMEAVNTDTDRYLDIEDIYGNMVRTSKDFYHYLKWFEEQALEAPEITVIDATEGGAKIKGTVIRTLKETIEEYCLEDINVSSYLEDVPHLFSKEQIEEVDQYLIDTPKELDKLRKKIKQGILDYEEAEFLVKRNEVGKKLKNSVKKLGKLTTFLEDDETMRLIRPFIFELDYVTQRRAADNKAENADDLQAMLKQGKHNLEETVRAINELEEDFKTMAEKVKELQAQEKEGAR